MPTPTRGSPLAKPLPRSPKVANLRQQVAQKSPVRSPLREVLKLRCAEQMKNNRSKLLAGLRGIDDVKALKEIVQSEAKRVRGRRRSLTFGISATEVDEALADLEAIEAELLEEYSGIMFDHQLGVVCPLCKKLPLRAIPKDEAGLSNIVCGGSCGTVLLISGGLEVTEKLFEELVNRHEKDCAGCLDWGRTEDGCLIVLCEDCDYCEISGEPSLNTSF
eukprot:TRINITY_DN23447_c0_g1_i1.p1 TRINITY_DN23447_c0_g1~~TRINITY_DN23447_c0_g1_i1.p1  ORF type:complete len:230 (-),score=21.16 TRINITY_DN23447_c0_g1_i1:249-905(-)